MIGIFGSAFNPPTRGHADAIEQALEHCDEVWLVPSICHPTGKVMLPFETRWRLVQRFVEDINDPRVSASCMEETLWDGLLPVYTVEVMAWLQHHHPKGTFAFVCGPDVAASLDQFQSVNRLRERWQIIEVAERRSIRSTLVRRSRHTGMDPAAWLTPSVADTIRQEALYG
jgi:nicotinate-nucleotide adenylyltransferase